MSPNCAKRVLKRAHIARFITARKTAGRAALKSPRKSTLR